MKHYRRRLERLERRVPPRVAEDVTDLRVTVGTVYMTRAEALALGREQRPPSLTPESLTDLRVAVVDEPPPGRPS